MQHLAFVTGLVVLCVRPLTGGFAVYGTINVNGTGEGHLERIFSQRVCGFISQEEDHEQIQQSSDVDCRRSARNGRRCPIV